MQLCITDRPQIFRYKHTPSVYFHMDKHLKQLQPNQAFKTSTFPGVLIDSKVKKPRQKHPLNHIYTTVLKNFKLKEAQKCKIPAL